MNPQETYPKDQSEVFGEEIAFWYYNMAASLISPGEIDTRTLEDRARDAVDKARSIEEERGIDPERATQALLRKLQEGLPS